MATEQKIVVITGASQGIGLATTEHLAKAGHKVYATTRATSNRSALQQLVDRYPGGVVIATLDVNDEASIASCIESIITDDGRVDVLINNAGYGVMGPVETITVDEVRQQFETNLFGVIRVLHAVVPHMRAQKSGHIINISSMAGLDAFPFGAVYSASKYALEGLTESMASNLAPWDIKVSAIEPGPVATHFGEAITMGSRYEGKDNPYADYVQRGAAGIGQLLSSGQPVEEVAAVIHGAIEAKHPHLRYQTSEELQERAAMRLKDTTGDVRMEERRQQMQEWMATTEK